MIFSTQYRLEKYLVTKFIVLYDVDKKIRNGLCTKWSLYEMIPRRVYVKIQIPFRTKILVRSDSYALVRKGLPCTK